MAGPNLVGMVVGTDTVVVMAQNVTSIDHLIAVLDEEAAKPTPPRWSDEFASGYEAALTWVRDQFVEAGTSLCGTCGGSGTDPRPRCGCAGGLGLATAHVAACHRPVHGPCPGCDGTGRTA